MGILIATLVVSAVGLIVGIALVKTEKKFHVETDSRVTEVRECLPGNNCGACGFAGCDAVAEAIVEGKAPANACPVCAAAAVSSIAAIMGVEASAKEKEVAFVRCSGTCEKTSVRAEYVGIQDCRAVSLSGLEIDACSYGCLGYGSCVKVCKFDAIHIRNGIALVDAEKCAGCGMCVKMCPRNLITMTPITKQYAVRCSNNDKGLAVKKACTAGCIGCMLCVKQCESGAISVKNNLASIDYSKCTGCGKCAEKCPVKVITKM